MQIIKTERMLAVVGQTVNRALEDIIDEYWRPPDFYATYVIIDDNDRVVKYRAGKRWYAATTKMDLAEAIELLNLIF